MIFFYICLGFAFLGLAALLFACAAWVATQVPPWSWREMQLREMVRREILKNNKP
jgi:hypothetical protein